MRKAFRIRLIPTQVFLDANGKELERHIGLLDEDALREKLRQYKILL